MELTIEQALQQGVAAHKEGKLQDAERLYRAILQSQPLHPDANHNLGVLAVSFNKTEVALPLFKTALEANPKTEQFWLSYIDALIKEKRFENAKEVLEQGKKEGLSGDKVDAFETELTPTTQVNEPKLVMQKKSLTLSDKCKKLAENKKKAKKQNSKGINPSEAEIKSLLEYYQTGRYGDAEKLAISITNRFPKHQFAWKVLGAVFKKTGRINESLVASQKSVQLAPHDPEPHNNLGFTLQELGRLDEAEGSLRQAIALKSDFAEAHNNLGITLHELGRLNEAEGSYREAIVLKPDYAEPHNNLGNMLNERGKLEEAEASYRQAIAFKSDYAEAHYNMGYTLNERGKLEEAEASYRQAIALKPDYAQAMLNLSIVLVDMNKLDAAIHSFKNVLQLDTDNYGLRAGVQLAICRFLEGDFVESRKYLIAASSIQRKTSSKFKNDKVYQGYLLKILNWHEDKHVDAYNRKIDKTLYVIGESHSLISHQLHVQLSASDFLCKSILIMGCKQWHLGNSSRNQYKNKFESVFCSLPKSSEVLLAIGEIDCRLNSGIMKHKAKYPQKDIKELILTTVENYLNYIVKMNSHRHHDIIVQGVSCPNIDPKNISKEDIISLVDVIKLFNVELQNKSQEKGFGFLDLHKFTDRGDGFSNATWHIDEFHLSADGMLEAWRRYAS